jgi:diguanylate cyclase (GGDEF)-like protein
VTVEGQLSSVLSEFARTMVTDFTIQTILDHLVVRIVDVLPIDAAGVTLIVPGEAPLYVAASDDSARRFEQLQTELDEGPCIEAYRHNVAVSIPDLGDDERFPTFAARALSEGLVAVFTFPLRHGEIQLGALDLYRTTPGALDEDELAAAQTLADVAAAYLVNAQTRQELQESSSLAQHTSMHDQLTGLANRAGLVQDLEDTRLRCLRRGKIAAVLYSDLDLFKSINDTYGHHVGDELLVAVAQRLTALMRPGDTIARPGGDEFIMLCDGLDDPVQIDPIVARISRAVGEVFQLSVGEVRVSASIGIAFLGEDDTSSELVLQEADMAMYQAKRDGGDRHTIVDVQAQASANHRAGLSRDLRGALGRNELHLVYQPIVAAADGLIVGVEALLRWTHPIHGTVPPSTTIPLAEQYGLISDIGRWVLEQACVDLARWQQASGRSDLSVFVNTSGLQLMSDGYVKAVADTLAVTGTDPARITLEITESAFIGDAEQACQVLQQLKQLGVRLALDDFGSGHASIRDLKNFPVDIVKIDREFIAGLTPETGSHVIVDSMVRLAHNLGMSVVAEGIETAEQYDLSTRLGCALCQGFYIGRPTIARTIEDLVTGPPHLDLGSTDVCHTAPPLRSGPVLPPHDPPTAHPTDAPDEPLAGPRLLDPGVGFSEACAAVVDFLNHTVPMGFWAVTRYDGYRQLYLEVRDWTYGKEPGDWHLWDDSFCINMVAGRTPQIAPDAMSVSEYANSGVADALDIGSYIGVPIHRPDGELFGTLCGLDPAVRSDELLHHQPLLQVLGSLLSTVLEADLQRTAVERELERVRLTADTDPLTGLFNRRAWDRYMQLEEARLRRFGDPGAVIVIDLDQLKAINDTQGHAAGDQHIRCAARVIAATVRSIDVVARLGGDEFGVIATDLIPTDCQILVERILEALETAGIAGSIGQASYTIGEGLRRAHEQADADMYTHKRRRRVLTSVR